MRLPDSSYDTAVAEMEGRAERLACHVCGREGLDPREAGCQHGLACEGCYDRATGQCGLAELEAD